MNARLKAIRKTLQLSQEDFGRRLGITGSGLSNLESGKRNITEQMIKSICNEFDVDYRWLTTGEGDMFVKCDDDIAKLIDRVMYGESELAKSIFKGFAQFDTDDWKNLEVLIKKFLSGCSVEEVEAFINSQTE